MNAIFTKLLYEAEHHSDTVLVSIAAGEGSTPRGPGSLMLVGSRGRILGTIGGGKVEHRAEEVALECLEKGRSDFRSFGLDLSAGPESLGMACGGRVSVFFQRIPWADPHWNALARQILARLREGKGGALVLDTRGECPPALLEDAGGVLPGTGPGAALLDQRLYLPLPVRARAVIFGAGHIARALVPLLQSVDFRPVVFDCRRDYADPAAFPQAEAVLCGDFDHIAGSIAVTPEDYAVVMTSGHLHDLTVERQLLRAGPAYLGVIGSRAKVAFVRQKLLDEGFPPGALDGVYSPVGIAIRAVTPAEIAVSIAGEMIRVRAERRAGPSPGTGAPC